MDSLRKYGMYLVAGVLIVAAISFFFLVARKTTKQREEETQKLSDSIASLQKFARLRHSTANPFPSPANIEAKKEQVRQINANLASVDGFLGSQPRQCHTRGFFKNEDPTHIDYGREIPGSMEWLEVYGKLYRELYETLEKARMPTGWAMVPEPWRHSGTLPDKKVMEEVQKRFWLAHDLAELLTDGTEGAFQRLIDQMVTSDDPFPKSPADLVRTFEDPDRTSLAELLLAVPQESLRQVLDAILINDDQLDLPGIFDKYLGQYDFPWKRVQDVTMNRKQRLFLGRVSKIDARDIRTGLSNHDRFTKYVDELRGVRYRADVVELLKQHDFSSLASKVAMLHHKERRATVRQAFANWNKAKLAAAIVGIVLIEDDKDYKIVRDNHNIRVVQLATVRWQYAMFQSEKTSEQRGRQGRYNSEQMFEKKETVAKRDDRKVQFQIKLKIAFSRFPTLMRKLLNSSWHYTVSVERAEAARGKGSRLEQESEPGFDRRSREERPENDADRFANRGSEMAPPRPGFDRRSREERPENFEVAPPRLDGGEMPLEEAPKTYEGQKYIWLTLDCTAHRYTDFAKFGPQAKTTNPAANAAGKTPK